MAISVGEIEELLLKESAKPWVVNLSNSGTRIIAVGEWLKWATVRFPGADRAELERISDEAVQRLGGEKLELQEPREYVVGLLRRLVGRAAAAHDFAYAIPGHAFGESCHTLADQITTAKAARTNEA